MWLMNTRCRIANLFSPIPSQLNCSVNSSVNSFGKFCRSVPGFDFKKPIYSCQTCVWYHRMCVHVFKFVSFWVLNGFIVCLYCIHKAHNGRNISFCAIACSANKKNNWMKYEKKQMSKRVKVMPLLWLELRAEHLSRSHRHKVNAIESIMFESWTQIYYQRRCIFVVRQDISLDVVQLVDALQRESKVVVFHQLSHWFDRYLSNERNDIR